MVRDRGTWCAAVHEVARIGHDLATEQQQIQVTTGKRGERKRVFPATSENKNVRVISGPALQRELVSPKSTQEGEKYLPI